MKRRFRSALISLLVLLVLLSTLTACGPQEGEAEAAQAIRLYQVLPVARADSPLVEREGQGEVIALINAGSKKHILKGWGVAANQGKLLLPQLTLEPGQVIYLANSAVYFQKYWNQSADYEYGADTDMAVPDLKVVGAAPILRDEGDIVTLLDEGGNVVDILAYGLVENPPAPWSGPAVELVNSFPLIPANQVITRRKQGEDLLTQPSADAWSGGTRQHPERVFYAGQPSQPVRQVTGPLRLTALAAPDNAAPELFRLVDQAQRSIRLTAHQFTSRELVERLIAAAGRGVRVQVAVPREPESAGPFGAGREIQTRLHEGGVELLYTHAWDGPLSTRFQRMNAKYGIIDDEIVLISTGDWTGAAYPADLTCGNREWAAVIQGSPEAVKLFKEVWEADFGFGQAEVRGFREQVDRIILPDSSPPGPCYPYRPVKPVPQAFQGNVTLTRILSPDNALDREQGFLGLLRNAKQELLISATAIDLWWGEADNPANIERYPSPYLQEIVAAARRGVEVKVLLDRGSQQGSTPRSNPHVVDYLNRLAGREGLKLEARLINLDQTGISRSYHSSGLIVDGAVVISSMNGSESSFRYAREMAIKIDGLSEFTAYYRDLFLSDWTGSERPGAPSGVVMVPLRDGTRLEWAANAEPDVTAYAIYYKPEAAAQWEPVAAVEQPGFEDRRTQGIWGVAAVNQAGKRSNIAEVKR